MICSNCGNPLNPSQNVCQRCGMLQNYNSGFINVRKENVSFNKTQKKVILSMMAIIILLLIASAFFLFDNEKNTLDDGSRTIMIYMVGSNLEYESRIVSSELNSIKTENIDLNKVNVLLYTGGTKMWHNFIKNDENAIYQLKVDGFEKVQTYDKKNMGDYTTLLEFLNYGYNNFSTQYYDVVFYNHGGAVDGAIYDDFTRDNLSLAEFSKALENSQFNENNKLNTVLFRTCLNGTIEVASIFAPYAEYLIASEEITNGKTNESVLNYINNIDNSDDGISYGKKFIKAYEEQMNNIDPLGLSTVPMYSIIDLSKIEKINTLLEDFISGVDLKKNYNSIVRVRSNLYQYGYTSYNYNMYDTVDLYTLVTKLSKYSNKDSSLLLSAIEDAVIYNWSEEEESKGLSIYFPYNASLSYQSKILNVYENLAVRKNYYNFINNFKSFSASNKVSSFVKDDILSSETSANSREVTLKLTDEQANDYAKSIFIIFKKDEEKEGFYYPVYSSDKTIIEDGVLKTNIVNNLIKIYDKSKPNDVGEYLSLTERGSGEKKLLSTVAMLRYFESDDNSYDFQWDMINVSVYFEIKDGVPRIVNYHRLDEDENVSASGSVVNADYYQWAEFASSSYKILDENGNYTSNWGSNNIATSIKIDIPNIGLKLSTLDDDGEYYCVFRVKDIYGNVFDSNLIKIK